MQRQNCIIAFLELPEATFSNTSLLRENIFQINKAGPVTNPDYAQGSITGGANNNT
jgi:hypothetical protein